jgi:predicted permease
MVQVVNRSATAILSSVCTTQLPCRITQALNPLPFQPFNLFNPFNLLTMQIILTSILPICFIVALGAILTNKKFLPISFFTQLNKLGFYILLPALLFYKIATAQSQAVMPGLRIGLLLCVCSLIITFMAYLTAKALKLPGPGCRSLMQAAMRGNLAYSGLPIVLFSFGPESEIALLAVLCLIPAVPFYNFLAVIILTPHDGSSHKERIKKTLFSIARNPLIIGCLLGLAVMLIKLEMPAPILRSTQTLGYAALPCALLSLGAGLSFNSIHAQIKAALAVSVLKLILMPLLGFLLLKMCGEVESGIMLTSMIYLASPTAVTSYVMAEQMGADKDLAAASVSLSTICAVPVLAIILYLFG